MYTPISYALSRVNKNKTKLNILTLPTHEAFQTMLDSTGHNFYMMTGPQIKGWDFHTKPLPPNHYLLPPNDGNIQPGIEYDLLLSQQRFGNLQMFLDLGKRLGVPVLHIDHTMPPPNIKPKQLDGLVSLRANKHAYITEFSKNAWRGSPNDAVIYHGVDSNVFKGWGQVGSVGTHGISVVNQFASRDVFCGWNMWQEVAKQVPMKLIGENPGVSESAKSTEDLVNQLATARFFLNTSQWSPIPLSLIEAMMVGCPIITTSKQEIPKFLHHEENALIADNVDDMVKSARRLMVDDDLCKKLSQNVRATALQFFSLERFVNDWNDILVGTYKGLA
jgi:hypothetical protein